MIVLLKMSMKCITFFIKIVNKVNENYYEFKEFFFFYTWHSFRIVFDLKGRCFPAYAENIELHKIHLYRKILLNY